MCRTRDKFGERTEQAKASKGRWTQWSFPLSLMLVSAALIAPSAAAQSAPSATRPTQAQIDLLLKQLGAADWQARQQALDELVKLGEPVIGDLERIRKQTGDEEVRTRAEAAIRQIDATSQNPTRITMHMKDASVPQVLAELAKQAKVRIEPVQQTWPNPPPRLSIDVDVQPFWLVMKEIARKTGIGPAPLSAQYDAESDGVIRVVAGSDFATTPGQMFGPVYIAVGGTTRAARVWSMFIDPKWIGTPDYRLTLDEVIDEKGNVLGGGRPFIRSGKDWPGTAYHREVQVPLAAKNAQRIATLKGSIEFSVSSADWWEVPEVLAAQNAWHPTPIATWTMPQLQKVSDNEYRVRFRIDYLMSAQARILAIAHVHALPQIVSLLDADGRAWRTSVNASVGAVPVRMAVRTIIQTDRECIFTRDATANPPLGAPNKLVCRLPIETDVQVPFAFTDLDLPPAAEPAAAARPSATRRAATPPPLEVLVKLLADQDAQTRQIAQDELVRRGDAVLAELAKLRSASAEADLRARIDATIKQIEAGGPYPTRITLHLKDASVLDVLAELSNQSKVVFDFENRPLPQPVAKLSIDVESQPFWLVMKEIAQKTGVGPVLALPPQERIQTYRHGLVRMMAGSDFAKLPGQAHGCFYVTLGYENAAPPLRQATSPYSLVLTVFMDPKLLVGQMHRREWESVRDENGRSLTSMNLAGTVQWFGTECTRKLEFPMLDFPGIGNSIPRFKGTIFVKWVSKLDVWEVPDVLNARNVSHAAVYGTWVLPQLEKVSDDEYRVKMSVEYQPQQASLPINTVSMFGDYVRLVDAAGRPWQVRGGYSNPSSTLTAAGMRQLSPNCNFVRDRTLNPQLGEPAKLILELPLENKEIPLPLDYQNIPLPPAAPIRRPAGGG